MDLWEAAELDVRPTLPEERNDLLGFLAGLTREQWLAPSAAPGWTVKDLALHLLDDDLGWLSRGRDNDQSSLLDVSDHASFVEALAAKNQMWVDGARGLSLPVVRGLLDWTGEQLDAYYASLDLRGEGRVSWASDGPSPSGSTLHKTLRSGGFTNNRCVKRSGRSATMPTSTSIWSCGP